MLNIYAYLRENPYPGRGIIVGKTMDEKAVFAYFIMGRSENSRNRIFVKDGDDIKTRAFDEKKLVDPSLIIYSPVRIYENQVIVTNGDQTDTIYEGLKSGRSFIDSLEERTFEPDAPNFTPRISALLKLKKAFSYRLSILKSDEGDERSCQRFFFEYANPQKGIGHLIHTYSKNENPLPSFDGEPKKIELTDDIDTFTKNLWESLEVSNRISLIVRYIDISTGAYSERLINGLEEV